MPEETTAPAKASREPVAEDLSEEIVRSVEKRPEDRVTCRRIYGRNYRCNWWSPAAELGYDNPRMEGLLVTTHRVRLSRFLRATKTASGLVLTDWVPAMK